MKFKLLVTICFVLSATGSLIAQPFLSSLNAAKNDPLYSTYAAHMSRSEFILDKAYQFIWYDSLKSIGFINEKSGCITLGMKNNGVFKYLLGDVARAPVIDASYADLVRYHYYSFEKIRVDASFLVHSSRGAIQEIRISNESTDTVWIDVYPLFMRENGDLTFPSLLPAHNGVVFNHQELPDGWTIDHQVPYISKISNVFLIDTVVDAYGGYKDFGSEHQSKQNIHTTNLCVEWGLVTHADGSPCRHAPPLTGQLVFHNGGREEILTEAAPKWGDVDPNIPGNGFQGCELGNFTSPPIAVGDSFMVVFSCRVTGQQGLAGGKIWQLPAATGIRTDIALSGQQYLASPQQVSVQFSENKTSATIMWKNISGLTYSIYRRTYPTPGRYTLLKKEIIDGSFVDLSLNADSSYGYVLVASDSSGRTSGHSIEVGSMNSIQQTFYSDAMQPNLSNKFNSDTISVLALQKRYTIPGGTSGFMRIIRVVGEQSTPLSVLVQQAESLRTIDMEKHVRTNEREYSSIPKLSFTNRDLEMLYWNSFSLLRQCMLPPEGQLGHNYYVFSREPQWGWGHGGQVFHESLSMLAYVYMDPVSAMNSQRVFFEVQMDDGYINYRTGPYLNETIPFAGSLTTSAPWLSWENLEIYRVSLDTAFLREAYDHGTKLYNYFHAHRDSDTDTLCEWGGHAMLECVRDGLVAVWDQVGWPSNFEALDLNCMLVREAKSLSEMASALGLIAESRAWNEEAQIRTALINRCMWDAQTTFYYNVDKTTHAFSYRSANDLKRKEIIGFLPLWAGVADRTQAAALVQHLKNPSEFWRINGIPSLSAADPYYNPTGYWNGPVWVQWQYLIFRGLLDYGYIAEARQLMEKVSSVMITQLKKDHWFWELYSPDDQWAGWNKTYIWAGIVARMLIDMNNVQSIEEDQHEIHSAHFALNQNYPNPFNASTTIHYSLAYDSHVTLQIHNVLGQQVAQFEYNDQSSGWHSVVWRANVPSGIYFYRFEASDQKNFSNRFTETKKMILLR
jgi:hypothetical protein